MAVTQQILQHSSMDSKVTKNVSLKDSLKEDQKEIEFLKF